MHRLGFGLCTCALLLAGGLVADSPAKKSPREALTPFNDLIGTWRGTGTPAGSREEQQKGFWTEQLACEWRFKGSDAWIEVAFKDSKHFTDGQLRYDKDKDRFTLSLKTPKKESVMFAGELSKEKILTLEREDKGQTHRLVITLLHSNRFLYRYEVRPEGKSLFAQRYKVGATKEGVPFAGDDGRPECIVSGGLGTIAVSYKGQTYYVCCSGCRAEFNESPEKYIKEYQEKKAKKK